MRARPKDAIAWRIGYLSGRDILGLTKLNYNACKLGTSLPVTVGFSNAVGEILISNPAVKHYLPQFKYYI